MGPKINELHVNADSVNMAKNIKLELNILNNEFPCKFLFAT